MKKIDNNEFYNSFEAKQRTLLKQKQDEIIDTLIALENLEEEVNDEEIGLFLYQKETGLSYETARERWTGKHYKDSKKDFCALIAQALKSKYKVTKREE